MSYKSVVVAALVLSAAVPASTQDEKKGGKRPGLELRSSPRFAFSPASILFTAELKGGDDTEDLYCPEIEWEWGDGGKSITEADCEPWVEGSAIERRFTANHVFQRAGIYRIKVTLKKTGRNIVSQSLALTIRAGLGDTSPDPGD